MKNRIQITLFAALLCLLALLHACDRETLEERRASAIYALSSLVSADSLESFVEWVEGMGTRFALADNRRDVAIAILNRFAEFGVPDVRLDSFMISGTYRDQLYELWQYNVVATIEGDENPGEIYILGAHYDAILREGDPWQLSPGANDNASGLAAALEIARVLCSESYTPAETITFIAFGAEELGLYGSYDYAGKAAARGDNIVLMLNNDMIGYETSANPLNWFVNILDYENSSGEREKADKIAERYTRLITYNDNTYSQYSDSWPFAQNGFPALFFHNNSSDPNYHTPDDLAVNCNFEYCREVTLISLAILVENTF